jgi:hypothetical protein
MLDISISDDREEITFTTTCDACGTSQTSGGLRGGQTVDTSLLYEHEDELESAGWKLNKKGETCPRCRKGKK